MKKYFFFCVTVFYLPILFSQGSGKMRMMEKLEAQRVAFITNRLDLNADESARFWPLYNEYSKKRLELRRAKIENARQDGEESIEGQFEQEEQALKLKRNYYDKFKTVLPVGKVAKLDDAEKEFRLEVIRALKQRRSERNR